MNHCQIVNEIRSKCKDMGLVFRESNFKINNRNAYEFVDRKSKEPVYQNTFKRCFDDLMNGNIKGV